MAADAVIVRLRISRLVEFEDRDQEIRGPPDEQQEHEPVAELEHVIHQWTVLGGVGKDAEESIKHEIVRHLPCPFLP